MRVFACVQPAHADEPVLEGVVTLSLGMFLIKTFGELHGVKTGVSSAHSKLAPASGEPNVNVSVVLPVSSGGRPTVASSVSGAASIVHVNVAGVASGWSAGSTARTRRV